MSSSEINAYACIREDGDAESSNEAARTTNASGLCHDCAAIDFSIAFKEEAWDVASKERHWVVLQDLSTRSDWVAFVEDPLPDRCARAFTHPGCWLCETLSVEYLERSDLSSFEPSFEWPQYLVAIDRWQPYRYGEGLDGGPKEMAPNAWEAVEESGLPRSLYLSIAALGSSRAVPVSPSLFFQNNRSSPGYLEPRVASLYADMDVAKSWVNACRKYHPACTKLPPGPRTRLIDCTSKQVVKATDSMEYVALSYVWGTPSPESKGNEEPYRWQAQLRTLPQTVEDAIVATKALGYRYLWVDKYCIKQDDEADKMNQINNMDLVYQRAVVTIIVAAGQDSDYGIPGVQNRRRVLPRSWTREHFTFAEVARPESVIEASHWNTRGWTFQEGVLSSRRLVFTESFMVFECLDGMSHDMLGCAEHCYSEQDMKEYSALAACLDLNLFFTWLSPAERENMGTAEAEFGRLGFALSQYTQRKLSHQSDAFNAFRGVARMFEKAGRSAYNACGVIFAADSEMFSADGFFAVGLSWALHRSFRQRQEGDLPRNNSFPSWSWGNFMGIHVQYEMDLNPDGFNMGFGPVNIGLRSDDAAPILTLEEYVSACQQPGFNPYPCFVHLDAFLLSAEAFVSVMFHRKKRTTIGMDDPVHLRDIPLYPRGFVSDDTLDFVDGLPLENMRFIAGKLASREWGLLLLGIRADGTHITVAYFLILKLAEDSSALRLGRIRVADPGDLQQLLSEHGIQRTALQLR